MPFVRLTVYVLLCLTLALAGLMVPAYFQAIDPQVAALASETRPGAVEQAEALQSIGSTVAAGFLLESYPDDLTDGRGLYPLWSQVAATEAYSPELPAVTPLLTRLGRDRAVDLLTENGQPGVRALLELIPGEPGSASLPEWIAEKLPARIGGILVASLVAERALRPGFFNQVAYLGERSEAEPLFSSVAIWGSQLPFDAMVHFANAFENPAQLIELTESSPARSASNRALLARLILTGANPAQLLRFIDNHPTSGFRDIKTSFQKGAGGAKLLIAQNKPLRKDIFVPASVTLFEWEPPIAFALNAPAEALIARTALFTAAAFFLLLALHSLLPNLGDRYLASPTAFQSFFRRLILGIILAGAFLFFLEPSLLRQPETAPPSPVDPPRLSLSSLTNPPSTHMNSIEIDQVTLLILTIFFVLQVGLYVFCLVKLSEIRRQRVSDATKLHLLENEENLFDGGLYLGLGGTVASLIFLALGVVEASLMAAYASTLFGILSVSLFKIFHLRPLRRKLILSARAEA